MDRLLDKNFTAGGRIAVATQVVEAGVDVSAKTLFTELAPWASLVQRFGRCNRFGEHKEGMVFWLNIFAAGDTQGTPPKKGRKGNKGLDIGRRKVDKEAMARPYRVEELEAALDQLTRLKEVSPAGLEAHSENLDEHTRARLFPYSPIHVIRKKDLVDLFDATPDLAGNDIDISRFIREADDHDVQVFWRECQGRAPSDDKPPARKELCSVPSAEATGFVKEKNKRICRWDFLKEQWEQVRWDSIVPGCTYRIPADQGGYDPDVGWNPEAPGPVSVDRTSSEDSAEDANSRDRLSMGRSFQRINEHTDEVIALLEQILEETSAGLDRRCLDALRTAARWHDRGKAHRVFQSAVLLDDDHSNGPWAKAPRMKGYERRGFRHELAAALAMLQAGKDDLACYLAAGHHGKVRLSIRSLPAESRPPDAQTLFARGIWRGDTLPVTDLGGGETAPEVTLSLEPMELGLSPDGKPSWAERMLALRDDPKLGPFRLAFLEALLRAADMRASA
jgi:CRISPR-associated endonuclease/helicase Cas3